MKLRKAPPGRACIAASLPYLALVLICSAITPSPGVGQESIRGVIVNERGEEIENAWIRALGVGVVTRSDERGAFELSLPPRPVVRALEVRAVCYQFRTIEELSTYLRIELKRDPDQCREDLGIRGRAVSAVDSGAVAARALAGARIQAQGEDRHLSALADEEGYFRMRIPGPGPYRLSIAMICHASRHVAVNVADADVDLGEIRLEPLDSIRTGHGVQSCRHLVAGATGDPGA